MLLKGSKKMYREDLTLLTDFYEMTMMRGYHKTSQEKKTAVFDVFYRENPSKSGYAIMAGLQQVIEYIENLHFSESDIEKYTPYQRVRLFSQWSLL